MKRLILTILCMLAVIVGASGQRNLVIVHLNDTHSHLDPERSGDDIGRGGVIERAAYIDSLRQAVGKNNVLLRSTGTTVDVKRSLLLYIEQNEGLDYRIN